MNELNTEIIKLMTGNGADLVGFADLTSLGIEEMPFGVSVAVAVSPDIIKSIHDGPNIEYFDEYHRINRLLDKLVSLGAEYLSDLGYRAGAQTTDVVEQSEDFRTLLPHKTVATRAGLGWIGKCALLVTEEYGSAVRISSLITDAVIQCGAPINTSRCGNCDICVSNCPSGAVSGKLWAVEADRDIIFDPFKCEKAARQLSADRINREITLCGKCIEACPYTQRYISSTNTSTKT